METTVSTTTGIQHQQDEKLKKRLKRALLVLNCMMLGLGNCGGPLVSRLYFVKGGKRIWLSSWLLTGGWPLLIVPLMVSYHRRRSKEGPGTKMYGMNLGLFIRCAIIGILTGADDYLSAYGSSRLPVSTSALIIATQLAFTAGFAFLLVKQKFTPFIINAIFLLSLGAVILGFHSNTDRPAHESNLQYYIGFFMTLGTSALYGFVLPLMEFTCRKYKHIMNYSLVMEMQIVISIFATGFCTIGMLFNHDFQAISREATRFELGKEAYYGTLVANAVLWQFFFLGAIGVASLASALLSGIIIATLLPVTESLAVLFFHEKFHVEKGISLTLSIWGFISYFYGEVRQIKKHKQKQQDEQEQELGQVQVQVHES